jgi:hypothetical protein
MVDLRVACWAENWAEKMAELMDMKLVDVSAGWMVVLKVVRKVALKVVQKVEL